MFTAAIGCRAPGPGTSDHTAPLTGRWGGDHVLLILTPAGGEVEYDCAHGGISEPLRPDRDGRIAAEGVHVREHGGPMREGERPDSVPARYLARVQGDRLTLRVTTGTDTLGPFALQRDVEARLFKCL
jgi:hypothetical protein